MNGLPAFFNGHAGAGLGEMFLVAEVLALAASLIIFHFVLKSGEWQWLRGLRVIYIATAASQLLFLLIGFPQVTLMLVFFFFPGFLLAFFLGLVYFLFWWSADSHKRLP